MTTKTELERQTVQAAQAGNRAAQEVFLRRYAGPLKALIRRSGVPGEPEDLLHDLLSKMLRVLPQYKLGGPATLTTWVFAIAQRWLIDVSRRQRLVLAPLLESRDVADEQPNALALLEHKQLGQQLEQALQALPLDLRRLFVLAQVHQRPLSELAEAEGLPLGTVKSRLHRARALLAAQLLPVFGEIGDVDAYARGT